jgi:hypothetical protein
MKAQYSDKSPAEIKTHIMGDLSRLGALLDAKAPHEALAFKGWLNHIAEKVASASTEGGFLGFGGVRVSDAEKASLAEIASALNTEATS